MKVIHKENGGLSDARNVGIKATTGKYLMFVDSDDYWSTNKALDNISKKLISEELDELIFYCKEYNCLKNKLTVAKQGYNSDYLETHNRKDNLKYLFNNGLFPRAVWVTAVKRELVVKNDMMFHALLSRITGLQGYFSLLETHNMLKKRDEISPDIVHLHNLHANHINLNMLLKYLADNGITTIWTLHDC